MNVSETEKMIEDFVRGPLGCNCPDKVFEQIEQIDSVFNTVMYQFIQAIHGSKNRIAEKTIYAFL